MSSSLREVKTGVRHRRGMRGYALAVVACIAVLGGCSDLPARSSPVSEDCATPRDEDGNGLADCADPACSWRPACQPMCGNGRLDPGEACDDGNVIDGDGCDHNCTVTACGNGIVTAGEACDDGNAIDGDGCESCQFAACPGLAAVEPGKGDSLPLAGPVARLIASPVSCFVYALTGQPTPELVVFSAASKQELVRIRLPNAEDIAVSPSGAYLVVARGEAKQISIIDTATWRVARAVSTGHAADIVQVDNDGIAYYGLKAEVGYPEPTEIFRLDLQSRAERMITTLDGADVTLSRDGSFLYAGESGLTGSNLFKYAVSASSSSVVDHTTYNDDYGFVNGQLHTYLSPGGHHIYYAGFQLDANALDFVTGRTDELIWAEDAQDRFAIGADHVFDAALVRPVASLPHSASAAALRAGDQELWYYGAPGRLYYMNMSELIGGVALGVREVEPGPLRDYSFAKLIHDPVRPRLYGVDTARAAVVVIDDASLQPTRAILVGSTPTDLSIDATGTTLFVGHSDVQGYARIDLDSLTFERWVVAPRVTFRLAAVSNGRIVTINKDDSTTPSLLNAATGAVLSEAGQSYEAALGATADGTTVFIGESSLSSNQLTRYSLATGALVAVGQTEAGTYDMPRSTVALPDGSGVYFGPILLDGNNLTTRRYTLGEPIIMVTPDGRLALSATGVYDVATGRRLGALPVMTSALALSPDGTKAFQFSGGAITVVDLTAY